MLRHPSLKLIACCLALSACVTINVYFPAAAAEKASTPVKIGSKNFTEQFVLGQLYKQALEAKGYTVTYKENIGSSELIDTALTSGESFFLLSFESDNGGVQAFSVQLH